MDEQTLDQQTDETGDVFMWLKHQAQQGVTSAQVLLLLMMMRRIGMMTMMIRTMAVDEEAWPTDETGDVVVVAVVDWLLNVPATCQCISGTDLLRQFYVLPSCRSNFPSHPVTVY